MHSKEKASGGRVAATSEPMRIKPLTGQILVTVLPIELKERGLILPEIAADPNPNEQDPYRRKPVRKGIVKEIGPWGKSKKGFALMPEFGKGATVLFNEHSGQKLTADIGNSLRILESSEVLAVLTD